MYVKPGSFIAFTAKRLMVFMLVVKNSPRASVRLRSDWSVSKQFRGTKAQERFENEIRVMRFLESKLCHFVPRLIHADSNRLEIVVTHCGATIQHLSPRKLEEVFASLESFGVRHEEPALRNLTYRASDGSFCVIDFGHASIVDESNAPAQTFHRIDEQCDDIDRMLTAIGTRNGPSSRGSDSP